MRNRLLAILVAGAAGALVHAGPPGPGAPFVAQALLPAASTLVSRRSFCVEKSLDAADWEPAPRSGSSAALAGAAARSAVQGTAVSGPVEFGRSELDRAIATRRLNPRQLSIKTQVAVDPAESYRIVPGLITGGDLRGLMYGLLEAAVQVRKSGRLQKVEAKPGMTVRGARVAIDDFAGDLQWFQSREQWPALFRSLAIGRFNQFQIAVPDLAGAGSEQNLDALHFISDTAAEYGIDFTLGVGIRQAVEGPELYAALIKVLAACPAIRGVRLRMDAELARDAIRAIQETGRRVTIELPEDAQATAGLAAAAGLPVRFSAPYPGVGRPAKGTQFFWELGTPPAAAGPELTRLVNRLAGTGADGFEIDLPAAMFGKGSDPLADARGSVPSAAWLSLGRLAYDVSEPE